MRTIEDLELLREKYKRLKEEKSMLRARDAAEYLGVSEAELLSARLSSEIIKLTDTPEEILLSIDSLQKVSRHIFPIPKIRGGNLQRRKTTSCDNKLTPN